MVGSHLTRFATEQRFLIWDTESEGLNLAFHRPWEVAYALCTQKEVLWVKSAMIWWPDLRISRGAAIKTRFNPDEYKAKARPPTDVLSEFETYLLDPSIRSVGHSVLGFDTYMHSNWRRGIGLTKDWSWVPRLIDTNAIVKAINRQWVPDISSSEAFTAWQYRALEWREKGLKSNLGDTAKAWGVEFDAGSLHRGEADVRLNHAVFAQALFKSEF